MSRRNSPTWIVAGGAIGEWGWCQRCGEGLRLGSDPIAFEVLHGAMEGFIKAHRNCPDVGRREPEPRTPDEWIESRDVGVSSATIWSVMTGKPSPLGRYDVPLDGADLGRCKRLLARFPEWRERLGEVVERFPNWRFTVEQLRAA